MASAASDNKRRALGKGLESLLPSRLAAVNIQAAAQPAPAVAAPTGKPTEIPLD